MVDSSLQDEQWRLSDSNCQSGFILLSISTLLQVDCCTCTRLIRRSYRMNVCVGVEWFICVPPVAVWLWSSVWQFWHRYFTIFGEGAYYGSSLDLNMRSVTVADNFQFHVISPVFQKRPFPIIVKMIYTHTSMLKLSNIWSPRAGAELLCYSKKSHVPVSSCSTGSAALQCTGGNHMAPGKQ